LSSLQWLVSRWRQRSGYSVEGSSEEGNDDKIYPMRGRSREYPFCIVSSKTFAAGFKRTTVLGGQAFWEAFFLKDQKITVGSRSRKISGKKNRL